MDSPVINELLLKHLLEQPSEAEWIEFKENYCDPDKMAEILSALSNSANLSNRPYGYIIFGIKDNTKEIVGTTFSHITTKRGNENIESWLSNWIFPRQTINFIEVLFNKKRMVVVSIPSATDQPTTCGQTAYIRIGSTTRRLKDFPDMERKIWQNNNNRSFEKLVASEKVSDDEILKQLDYPYFFKITNQNLPENKSSIIDKLIEYKLIRKNEGLYDILNLGAILFATNLKDFPTVAKKAPRVIVYKGKDKTEARLEKDGTKGYAIAFQGIVKFINDQLPSNEEIREALRVESKIYPDVAIRELVANALIHQDLFIKGSSPMIEIYSDRIEITNPGKPLVDVDRFIDHSPRSRNEDLASFMRQIRICEERGSGVDKVIHYTELYQLPAPKFEANDQFTKVTLYSHKKLNDMEKDDKIRACYQHCCLKFVSNDFMNNSTLRKRFNIEEKNYSLASRIISDTINTNLIKIKDKKSLSKKHIKYIPVWA